MGQERAERRAKNLNALVKHKDLSYAPVQVGKDEWMVGQFLGRNQVGVVN